MAGICQTLSVAWQRGKGRVDDSPRLLCTFFLPGLCRYSQVSSGLTGILWYALVRPGQSGHPSFSRETAVLSLIRFNLLPGISGMSGHCLYLLWYAWYVWYIPSFSRKNSNSIQ